MVTGGSSGLGYVVAETFLRRGYRVMIVSRDQDKLDHARRQLVSSTADEQDIATNVADLTDVDQVTGAVDHLEKCFGRMDALINCVGQSDRGLVENLLPQRLDDLFQKNVATALLCSQAALPMLQQSGGVIVNIGSLASKVGARYIGGYSAAKHALAGMTQQLRLELKPKGVHVALVCPGPIRRDDAGSRYQHQVDPSMPTQASDPGGGTRLKGLDSQRVADAIYRCVSRRRADVILPASMRLLIAIGHAIPKLGDWLLIKFTSTKS